MDFKDKYTDDKNDLSKKLISSEAFLLAEMLQSLIDNLNKASRRVK